MPKAKVKNIINITEKIDENPVIREKSEKEKLLELYQKLKDLNIRSISDLENLIARAE